MLSTKEIWASGFLKGYFPKNVRDCEFPEGYSRLYPIIITRCLKSNWFWYSLKHVIILQSISSKMLHWWFCACRYDCKWWLISQTLVTVDFLISRTSNVVFSTFHAVFRDGWRRGLMTVLGKAQSACRIRDLEEQHSRWQCLVSQGLEKNRVRKELRIRHTKVEGFFCYWKLKTLQDWNSFNLN